MNLNSRILTGSATLSTTDDVVVLNDTTVGSDDTITLPGGTNDMTIIVTLASTNIAQWTVNASGTDQLDATIVYPHGTFTRISGTWYLCY